MWYRALLSSEQLSAGCVATIRSQFAIAIQSAGEPTGACLFVTSREIPDVTGPATAVPERTEDDAVYFSPASVAVVREMIAYYDAKPSPPPARGRAVLLVGSPADWDLLPRRTH